MELFLFLGKVGVIAVVVNTILFFKSFTYNGKAFKIFTYYLLLISIIQVATYLFREFTDNNLYMSNVYIIVQFAALTLFYRKLLNLKILLYIGVLVLTFLGYQYVSDFSLFLKYNSIGIALTQGLIVVYALLYFYFSLAKKDSKFLLINLGVFLYMISSSLILASGNLVFNFDLISRDDYILLLTLNNAFYIIFQILVFIAWYINFRIKPTRYLS
ncbi:hypothetical protein [Marixanthomonas ophiurae]|uniref:YhhN-like protein n=1 Tax=Marixanthomonas ophiurae TaxID=387659 RepID=A0A3E1Q6Y4_9FLAO|nr:hypothetical protein [Marixanthomonas ophiurae]RFN57893.1 hypothetical protein DZ858_11655 [Marixanthomonas ophiurae]